MSTAIAPDVGQIPTAISIIDVLRGVRRRKLMIVSIALLAFLAGLGVVSTLKAVYSTEAQVLIENLETPFDRVQSLDGQAPSGVDDRIVASQMFVLESEDLGRRVVAALGLENIPEFNPMLNGLGILGGYKIALGFGDDPRLKTPEQRALARYNEQLSVYQQPNSNVINIKYSARNPEIAAKIANTLADTYVLTTRERQSQPTERAREWLSQQIAALRSKLAESEAAVENFRSRAGLLQGATTTLGTQEISELNTQISVAQGASTEARSRADAIRQLLANKGSVDSSSEVLASPVIQRLKEQRTDATRQIAELSATYLPNHPKMIAAQSQLANLDRLIRGEAMKIVTGLEEQATIAESREASLRASLEEMKSQESSANLDEVKLKALERDAAADRILLETMLGRYADASSRQDLSSQPGMARVIQAASVPASPSFPKRGPMVMLIGLAGLAIGLGLAFLLEIMAAASQLTQRMIDAAAIQPPAQPQVAIMPRALAVEAPLPDPAPAPAPLLTPLATIPKAPQQASQAVENTAVSEAASALLAWAISARNAKGASQFAVTSVGGGQGDAALTSVALARSMARSRLRVLVADLSGDDSWLNSLCGVSHGPGLTDLLMGAADFTKVISRDTKSTAHIVRFGMDHSSQALELLNQQLGSMLAALTRSYEVIVINAGEAKQSTPILLHMCHAAILLAPAPRFAEASAAVQTLLSTGLQAAGVALIGDAQPAPVRAPDIELKAVRA